MESVHVDYQEILEHMQYSACTSIIIHDTFAINEFVAHLDRTHKQTNTNKKKAEQG